MFWVFVLSNFVLLIKDKVIFYAKQSCELKYNEPQQ